LQRSTTSWADRCRTTTLSASAADGAARDARGRRTRLRGVVICTTVLSYTDDPIAVSNSLHQLVGPDGLSYIWAEAPDESEIILARKDRNTGSYPLILEYNECTLGLTPSDASTDAPSSDADAISE
jgi:hypothetical protein